MPSKSNQPIVIRFWSQRYLDAENARLTATAEAISRTAIADLMEDMDGRILQDLRALTA